MKVDEFINNEESQQRNVYGSSIDSVCNTIIMFAPSRRKILSYVLVTLATLDVQSILEIPATPHGGSKPWSCLN